MTSGAHSRAPLGRARTLRKWMRELDLPYARLDGVVLILRARLEKWIEEHLTTNGEANRILSEIMADL